MDLCLIVQNITPPCFATAQRCVTGRGARAGHGFSKKKQLAVVESKDLDSSLWELYQDTSHNKCNKQSWRTGVRPVVNNLAKQKESDVQQQKETEEQLQKCDYKEAVLKDMKSKIESF